MLIDVNGSKFITYKTARMLSENIACRKEVAVAKADELAFGDAEFHREVVAQELAI